MLCGLSGLQDLLRSGLLLNELFALQGEAEGGGGGVFARFPLEAGGETAVELLTVNVGEGGGVGFRVLGAKDGGDGGEEGVDAVVRLEVEAVVEDGGFFGLEVPLRGGDEGTLLGTTGGVPPVFDGVLGAVGEGGRGGGGEGGKGE